MNIIKVFFRKSKNLLKKIFTQIKYIIPRIKSRKAIKSGKTLKIMSIDDTIDYIKENGCSISRYGDGEVGYMNGEKLKFQPQKSQLQERLKEVAQSNSPKVLICVTGAINDYSLFTVEVQKYYKKLKNVKYYYFLKYFYRDYMYGDALFTRFYIDYQDKRSACERLAKIKSLWEERNLLIIEGELSRLGVGNDLFNNANGVQRVICPSVDAFKQYNNIVDYVVENFSSNVLILIALGPTATTMAFDLSKHEFQTLDIGHIDLEYEWMLRKTDKKILIDNKFVNEVAGNIVINDLNNEIYEKQIMKRILNDKDD